MGLGRGRYFRCISDLTFCTHIGSLMIIDVQIFHLFFFTTPFACHGLSVDCSSFLLNLFGSKLLIDSLYIARAHIE